MMGKTKNSFEERMWESLRPKTLIDKLMAMLLMVIIALLLLNLTSSTIKDWQISTKELPITRAKELCYSIGFKVNTTTYPLSVICENEAYFVKLCEKCMVKKKPSITDKLFLPEIKVTEVN